MIRTLRPFSSVFMMWVLTLNPFKCNLIRGLVKFLGCWISFKCMTTQFIKVETIIDWLTSSNSVEVCTFLGRVGYYRWLVIGYAMIAVQPNLWIREIHLDPRCSIRFWRFKVTVVISSNPSVSRWKLSFGQVHFGHERQHRKDRWVLSKVPQGEKKNEVVSCGDKVLRDMRKLSSCHSFSRQLGIYLLGRRFTLRIDHQSLR